MPDTLYDFLLARIAEDEADIQFDAGSPLLPPFAWMQRRVLAECEAKRRIINHEAAWTDHGHEVLQLLALPYADHPDYRDQWRPLDA